MNIRRLSECTIKKTPGSYNDYRVELSFGQLKAIHKALASNHEGALEDELFNGIAWALAGHIPKPGEEESEADKLEKHEKETKDKEKSEADRLLPEPPKKEKGELDEEPKPGRGDGIMHHFTGKDKKDKKEESLVEATMCGAMGAIDTILPFPGGYKRPVRRSKRAPVAKSPGKISK